MLNTEKVSEWIYNNIKMLFITAMLSGFISMAGVLFLDFGSDFRSFFPKDSPLIVGFDEILDQYEKGETLALYLKLPNEGRITKDNIDAIQYADSLLDTLSNVRYVRSLASYQKPVSDEDSIDSQPLGEWAKKGNNFDQLNQYISKTSQLKGRLVSDDNSGALVVAQLDLITPRYKVVSDIVGKAEAMALDIEDKYPSVKVHIVGTVAFDDGLVSEFYNFSFITVPLATFFVSFVVAWVYGSYWIFIAGLTASGLTLCATAGIFGWLPVTFDPTSAMAVILVFTLTIVDCVHVAGIYRVCLRSMSKEAALKEAIRANLKPIFFTTLTTGVGLLTLFISESPPFILFAQVALVGILIGLVYTFILLTGVLYWAPQPNLEKKLITEKAIGIAKQLVSNSPKVIVGVFLSITIASLFLIPLNKIDEDVRNYFMPYTDFDKAAELLRKDFNSDTQITIDLKVGENQSILSPEHFLVINEFELWINSRPTVVGTFTTNDVIREIKALWDNKLDSKSLPKSKEEYSQLLLVYEMSLTPGQSTSEFISPDHSQTLMSVFTEDLSNSELLVLKSDIIRWWHQRGMDVSISGRNLIFAELSNKTVKNAMKGGAIACLLITFFMMYAFRSVRWGLFSLLPNLLPFFILFGTWGLFYGEISQATCLAFTIVIGFVVDDSIHFIMKFKDALKNQSVDNAIIETFDMVGFGITASTFMFIAAGLVIFSTSQFVPNAIVGIFMLSIVIYAWLFDLIFMPALLVLYYRRREKKLSGNADLFDKVA